MGDDALRQRMETQVREAVEMVERQIETRVQLNAQLVDHMVEERVKEQLEACRSEEARKTRAAMQKIGGILRCEIGQVIHDFQAEVAGIVAQIRCAHQAILEELQTQVSVL